MRVHYFIFHIMHLDGGEWHDVRIECATANLQLKCIHIHACVQRKHSLLIHSASKLARFSWCGNRNRSG